MMEKKSLRNIVLFVFIALSCGWLGVFIDRFIPDQPEGDTLGTGIWLVFPLLTTLLLRLFAGDGWKDMGLRLKLKGNVKWYVLSFLVFPVVTAVVLLIGKAVGWIDLSKFNTRQFFSVFAGLFILVFIKNIFEESVWRGYLTAKLSKLKIKDAWLYLLVGLVWGLWHLPYYLVFLSEAEMTLFLPVDRWVFVLLALVTMLGWTVLFVELFLITKSIWPVVLLHAVEDAFINPLVEGGFIVVTGNKELFISPVFGIIATLMYLAVGLMIRYKRKIEEGRSD